MSQYTHNRYAEAAVCTIGALCTHNFHNIRNTHDLLHSYEARTKITISTAPPHIHPIRLSRPTRIAHNIQSHATCATSTRHTVHNTCSIWNVRTIQNIHNVVLHRVHIMHAHAHSIDLRHLRNIQNIQTCAQTPEHTHNIHKTHETQLPNQFILNIAGHTIDTMSLLSVMSAMCTYGRAHTHTQHTTHRQQAL